MKASLPFCRRMLLVCAGLFVAAALLIALGVIPPVKADTTPGASPEDAVPAFWVIVGLNLLVAVAVASIAIWSKRRSRGSTSVLVVFGLVALLGGLALVDAAFAFRGHGPSMQTASTLLFVCVAADILAGAAVVTTAFLRPKEA